MNSLVFLLACSTLGADGGTWPSFLGRGASPVDPVTVPIHWSPKENLAWRTRLAGCGQSSPVIWNDRVFVTSIEGAMKDTCQVTALNLLDGRILWQHELPSSQKTRSSYFQARSAPTPVVTSEQVFAFFETGDVVALDHAGKRNWHRSLTKEYGEFESSIGLAASPLVTDTDAVILVDHEGPSYLLALDQKTGNNRWKTERTSRQSYSSPSLIPVGKSMHLVCSSMGSVDGYDPATGKLLWSFEEIGGNYAPTPLPFANGRFLVGASTGMHDQHLKEAKKSNLAMTIEAKGHSFEAKVLWRTSEAVPAFASPSWHQGCAYWVNKVGTVYCFDVTSGKQHYAERLKQTCWATPVGVGDRVYVFGKDGVTSVLAAGPQFRVLAENALWDPSEPGFAPNIIKEGGQVEPARGSKKESSSTEGPPFARKKPTAAESADSDGPPKGVPKEPKTGKGGSGGPGGGKRGGGPSRGFADPIQYGVALVNGSIVIRTGEFVYCVRKQP